MSKQVRPDAQEVERYVTRKVLWDWKGVEGVSMPELDELVKRIASALSDQRVAGEQAALKKAYTEEENDVIDGMLADAHESGEQAERERIREAVKKMRDRWSVSQQMKADFGLFREALLNHVLNAVDPPKEPK